MAVGGGIQRIFHLIHGNSENAPGIGARKRSPKRVPKGPSSDLGNWGWSQDMFQNIQFSQGQLEGGGFILDPGLGLGPVPGFHTLLG